MNTAFRFLGVGLVISLLISSQAAQKRARTELALPDLPGYTTLKCDFHMHTVFSDGLVWPTVRVEEAWRDGLDAIAIADHVEYLPHQADVKVDYDRSHQLALPLANSLGLLLIRAAEITRAEPPGHLNALFLEKPSALKSDDYRAEVKAAADQGAFLFWNHPGWKQPGGKAVWYREQGEFLSQGRLHGLEIVNGQDYDPIVHRWAIEKQLTVLGNTDIHDPTLMEYDSASGEIRSLTLVFAKERSVAAIKEALFARRTAVLCQNCLYGPAEYLAPIFAGSLQVKTPVVRLKAKESALVQVLNRSPVTYHLKSPAELPDVSLPKAVTLHAGMTSLLKISAKESAKPVEVRIDLRYQVTNLVTAPGEPLVGAIPLKVQIVQ